MSSFFIPESSVISCRTALQNAATHICFGYVRGGDAARRRAIDLGSLLPGHASVKITEKSHARFVKARRRLGYLETVTTKTRADAIAEYIVSSQEAR
jgi:hypothetical protein